MVSERSSVLPRVHPRAAAQSMNGLNALHNCLVQKLRNDAIIEYKRLLSEEKKIMQIINDTHAEWKALKARGENVLAIQAYRRQFNCGLKEAYDAVVHSK